LSSTPRTTIVPASSSRTGARSQKFVPQTPGPGQATRIDDADEGAAVVPAAIGSEQLVLPDAGARSHHDRREDPPPDRSDVGHERHADGARGGAAEAARDLGNVLMPSDAVGAEIPRHLGEARRHVGLPSRAGRPGDGGDDDVAPVGEAAGQRGERCELGDGGVAAGHAMRCAPPSGSPNSSGRA
jgi:hypothetical protein